MNPQMRWAHCLRSSSRLRALEVVEEKEDEHKNVTNAKMKLYSNYCSLEGVVDYLAEVGETILDQRVTSLLFVVPA